MSFSALDSALTGPLFASERMRALFSDRARLAAMIEVETALARAQARFGVVSPDLAPALDAITPDRLDIEAIGRETAFAGVPVISFVNALRKLLPPAVEPDFHRGATTQDIADTALVLQMRRAFALIAEDGVATMKALQRLASTHARTICAGRTYGQHAAPVTFGYKVAVWNMGIADVAFRARDMREHALVASLGGPVGTLAGMGAHRLDIADGFAAELGLAMAPISWHTRRTGMAEAGHWLAMLIGALARMAGDIAHLSSTEVAEVAEPHQPGRGGSSSMPHKRNPVSCTVILAAASAARSLALPLLDAMVSAHERPAGAWHAEWHALPQLFGLASGALREARVLAEGLEVDPARMAANLDATRGLLFTDAVAAELAPSIGAGAAHRIVTQAADAVRASGGHLRDVLARDHAVAAPVLDRAFAVSASIDAAAVWVGRIDPAIEQACERLR
jgi:3-carboxy-cis,cis-muconate cycloisomerase